MIGKNLIEIEETDSTNLYASVLLRSKEIPEGTIISAFRQSSGRGLGSNSWESEGGKNLTISIILYPSFLPIEKQFMLNKVVSLGVYDMITKLIGNTNSLIHKRIAKIKWPNDIYIGDKKVSGILIENAIIGNKFLHSIVGIGVNINQEIFLSDAPNPVSLKNITGKKHKLKECLELLCFYIDKRYSQLKNNNYKAIDEDYLLTLYDVSSLNRFL
jgi:BirA family biotin operon repressor/biotin-[acetyl-CoA-carboxylase] ligase